MRKHEQTATRTRDAPLKPKTSLRHVNGHSSQLSGASLSLAMAKAVCKNSTTGRLTASEMRPTIKLKREGRRLAVSAALMCMRSMRTHLSTGLLSIGNALHR